jgi:C1A family cysteine protease
MNMKYLLPWIRKVLKIIKGIDFDNPFLLFLRKEFEEYFEEAFDDPHWFREEGKVNVLAGHLDEPAEEPKKLLKKHAVKKKDMLYPLSFDWRSVGEDQKNYINDRVEWQGMCSSCTAFGTIAVMETAARIEKDIPVNSPEEKKLPYLSEAQLFFCSEGQKSSSGWYISEAVKYCQENGIAPYDYFPWNYQPPWDYDEQTCDLKTGWQKKITKISSSHTIYQPKDMKKWISERGPLIASINIYLDFIFYRDGVYKKSSEFWNKKIGGHCIACIGYDDKKKAWLCKNSWTEHWGMDGYFYIGYGQCGIDQSMTAIDGFSEIYMEE